MSSYYRQQLEDWLRLINVKIDKVLDVGGGSNPVRGRTRSWDVKEYKILDSELENPKQKVDMLWDLNEWIENSGKGWMVENNDIVFCLEVMEYIFNPVTALNNINYFLKKGGILYISFPFVYPHHNPEKYDYLRYTGWGVEKLLEKTGFYIKEVTARLETEPYLLQNFYRKEKMHPSRDYDNHSEIGYLVKAIKI